MTRCKMQDSRCKSLSCIRPCQTFRKERGIALVMVLVLSAIILAIIAALVYMLTSGTQVSGIQKRYKTAFEAGMGGKDSMYELISARENPGIANCALTSTFLSTCLIDKLTKGTPSWNAACNNSQVITPGTVSTYDMTCDFGTSPNQYRAYAKIVDTVEGNSSSGETLTKSGVVSSTTGEITAKSVPYLYTIEVDAENPNNSQERAKLSILYQY